MRLWGNHHYWSKRMRIPISQGGHPCIPMSLSRKWGGDKAHCTRQLCGVHYRGETGATAAGGVLPHDHRHLRAWLGAQHQSIAETSCLQVSFVVWGPSSPAKFARLHIASPPPLSWIPEAYLPLHCGCCMSVHTRGLWEAGGRVGTVNSPEGKDVS